MYRRIAGLFSSYHPLQFSFTNKCRCKLEEQSKVQFSQTRKLLGVKLYKYFVFFFSKLGANGCTTNCIKTILSSKYFQTFFKNIAQMFCLVEQTLSKRLPNQLHPYNLIWNQECKTLPQNKPTDVFRNTQHTKSKMSLMIWGQAPSQFGMTTHISRKAGKSQQI